MFAELRDNALFWMWLGGFALVMYVAIWVDREKRQAFDLGFRMMRFGAAFPILWI